MKLIQTLKRLAVPAVLFLALAIPSQAKPGKGKGHAYGLRKQDNWKKSDYRPTRTRRTYRRTTRRNARSTYATRRAHRPVYRSVVVDGERRYYRLVNGRRVYYTRTSNWNDGARNYIYSRLR